MFINGKDFVVKRYSSGELKLIKSDLDSYVISDRVEIVYFNEYSIFELLLILKYYLSKNIKVDLILTYLPYQRMDHVGRDELDTVNIVADIFNGLNLNSLLICEPHCDISCFKNCSSVSLIEKMKNMVFEEIGFDDGKDIVVLTDKGGLKRYGDFCENIVWFEKVRDENTGLIIDHQLVGDIECFSKALIVDDIISTGDTIINIIEKLESIGIKNIYVLSGHLEVNRYNDRIKEYSSIKKIFSSNSLTKKEGYKLKLFDVENLLKKK